MEFAKIFLGKNQVNISIDEGTFSELFHTAANKDLYIIKSKIPLPDQGITPQHSHDNYEFTIPLSHSPKLLIENRQFTLHRRNIFPSNPGQYHGPAEESHQHRIIVLQISPSELQKTAYLLFNKSRIAFENVSVPLDFKIEYLLEMFIDESQNKQTGYEFVLDNLSSILGATILRKLKSNLGLHEKSFHEINKKDIKRAIDFMHTNLKRDFSLNHIAELSGFSKYHFIRTFKQETGKTPYQYFIDLKIDYAIELIKTKKYSITEICFLCGFRDHSHFSRVFKNKTGVSPSIFKTLCS